MKTVKNSYHKKLIFPLVGVTINTNESKTVTDEQARQLITNKWITIQSNTTENIKKNVVKDAHKGRK